MELSAEEINEAEYLIMLEAKSIVNVQKTSITSAPTPEESEDQPIKSSSSASLLKQSNLSIINQFRNSCRSSLTDTISTSKKHIKSTSLTLKQEFSVYVSTSKSSRDFQSYWNDKKGALPILSTFTRRYNCIPATSVASESAFSVAGYVDHKQRASLSPKTLRYLMLLKSGTL